MSDTPASKVYDIQSVAKTDKDHASKTAALDAAGYEHYDTSGEHDSYRIDASKLPGDAPAGDDAAGDDAAGKKGRSR
ncbi:MAG TPA: hypothetical protein VGB53_00820 [Rubricoccaceae bacterium]|jgi:hypothetical protein